MPAGTGEQRHLRRFTILYIKKQSVHYRILRSYKDTLHGRSDWFRTSGLVVPNRNRKLFSDVSNDFSSFPLVFRYSRDLFGTPISACSARVCSNPCGQKRFPTKKTGSVFYVQSVCIVTPGRGLCKWFLRGRQFKDCGAIDKEYNHLVYTLSTW